MYTCVCMCIYHIFLIVSGYEQNCKLTELKAADVLTEPVML